MKQMHSTLLFAVSLLLFNISQSLASSSMPEGMITLSCLLRHNENEYVPPLYLDIDFKERKGKYYFVKKTENWQNKEELNFSSDYIPARRYLYFQRNDNVTGRPMDFFFGPNLDTERKEALILSVERYRYDLESGELWMIRKSLSNWDKGEAGEIHYFQSEAKYDCKQVD